MKENEVVKKILSYIEKNPEEDLCLDRISRELNYSKFYMERAFSEKMGCTIGRYIRQRRLEEAAGKLAGTDKPVIEIAGEAHYGSQQAFTLAFRQMFGCSPRQYRRMHSVTQARAAA